MVHGQALHIIASHPTIESASRIRHLGTNSRSMGLSHGAFTSTQPISTIMLCIFVCAFLVMTPRVATRFNYIFTSMYFYILHQYHYMYKFAIYK